jgi:hypothetical protein
MRIWIKNVVRLWAICVSKILGLRSFLLGDEPPAQNQQENPAVNNNQGIVQPAAAAQQQQHQNPFQFNIGLAHQALLQNNGPIVNQTFTKPTHFKLRVRFFLHFYLDL